MIQQKMGWFCELAGEVQGAEQNGPIDLELCFGEEGSDVDQPNGCTEKLSTYNI